jgi:hypothetical protein
MIFHRVANGLVLTLFVSPTPLRTGTVDFSVFIEDAASSNPVLDASVKLTVTSPGDRAISASLNRQDATNDLLYAASLTLPRAGTYALLLESATKSKVAKVTCDLEVLPTAPAIQTYWPYLTPVPIAILLFAVNRLLRRANRASV